MMDADKKQRIMQATEQLFKTRQFHEVTLDEVAKHADVGKGTIYLHFEDKEDLFFQTAVSGFDELCDLLVESRSLVCPFHHHLLDACQKISDFFRQRRPLFRMILAEGERALGHGGGLRQRWLGRRKEMVEAVARIIARGKDSGEVRSPLPADVLAEYLLGMLRTRATDLAGTPGAQCDNASLVALFTFGAAGEPGIGRGGRK